MSTASSAPYYPATGFFFTIAVAGTGTALQALSVVDGSFQEISGIEAKTEIQTVPEGGENRYAHQLPGITKHPNLVLRRGYVTKASFLAEWAAQTVGSTLSQPILTQTLVVMLLGETRQPLVAWNVTRAWPVRWVTGPLDSMKNDVLTEILEFSYAYVTRMPLNEAIAMVGPVATLINA